MKEDCAVNKICVRLCDEDGMCKAAYYTSHLADTLAMYNFMAEKGIPLYWTRDINDEPKEIECYIEGVSVNFGDKDNLLSIDLFCTIMD